MDDKLKAILEKVAKLRAPAANAGTQAEAEAAAAQAAALVAKYQIDEAQVEAADPSRAEKVDIAEEPLWKSDKRNEGWRCDLAAGLAELHGCGVTYVSAVGYTKYRIAGRPSDVAIVRYLFAWLDVEVARLSRAEHGRAAKNAFRAGAVIGVLCAMKRARAVEQQATPAGQTFALATVDNHDLALEVLSGGKKLRSGPATQVSDGRALHRGFLAGGNLAPKQALTAGDGTLLLTGGR